MGFLDNSGDIILDAVLTDLGRERMARGDGSFKITKFALGDDEINYGNYDKNHASGSAYYDLEILQTPVLEAFTNNASSMLSKLISLSRNDILYLPVIMIDTNNKNAQINSDEDAYVVACNDATQTTLESSTTGILFGIDQGSNYIEVDQGLNTTEIDPSQALSADLVETQYLIEIDNRLGSITDKNDKTIAATVSFIDDDNIAYYYLTTSDTDFVKDITSTFANDSAIRGPRGTQLSFKINCSIDLQSGTSLFTRLGSTQTAMAGKAGTYNVINSIIRISGVTTGYRLDVPVKFVKQQ